jgi:hypothetical protein
MSMFQDFIATIRQLVNNEFHVVIHIESQSMGLKMTNSVV